MGHPVQTERPYSARADAAGTEEHPPARERSPFLPHLVGVAADALPRVAEWPLRSRGAEDTARDLQRRRDRDPDHDHGARAAHSGWNVVARTQARTAGAPGVRAQLRVPRDLLEQPPPHAGS